MEEQGGARIVRTNRAHSRTAAALLGLAILLSACSSDVGAPIEGGAPPDQTAVGHLPPPTEPPTPSVLGSLGKPLAIPGLGTVTVERAAEWSSASPSPAAGFRFVAVTLSIAGTATVQVPAAQLALVDGTGIAYRAVSSGMTPALVVPLEVTAGQILRGVLTFQVPYGGNYMLEIGPAGAAIAGVQLTTVIAAVTPSPPVIAVVTPSPPVLAVATQPPPGSNTATTSSGWTAAAQITAAAYRADVNLTYVQQMQEANYQIAIAGFQAPGLSSEEAKARRDQAVYEAAVFAINAVGSHFAFMEAHQPASCFVDAYLADVAVGEAFIKNAEAISNDPSANANLDSAFVLRDKFLSRLSAYFSDCHS